MRFDALAVRAAGDLSWQERECWADHVQVEFPSVRPIVDRMRLAFFGGEDPASEPCRAELRLSQRQARLGARVSVDVPVQRTCAACGGRGEICDDPCGACGGRGYGLVTQAVDVVVPAGVRDGAWLACRVRVPRAPVTGMRLRVRVA